MKKLILFDLDGVIADTKQVHYEALNHAISLVDPQYVITESEHVLRYDGLKTRTKLNMLSDEKGLPVLSHDFIYNKKQELTIYHFSKILTDERMRDIFKTLKDEGYILGCCTNCIRRTALVALAKTGVIEYLDVIVTNDDVKNPKPHPEMYWKAISMMGCLPEETVIIEDSPQGLLAATRSRADVVRVKNSADVALDKIYAKLKSKKKIVNKWKIVEIEGITEGAACTTLLAKEFINNDSPLIITNSDQFIDWNSTEFMYQMNEKNYDGGIVTFPATHPKWSFAKVDKNNLVLEVAEKKPISDQATAGIYYWKHGSDYVRYTEQMVKKDIRVNNEFYVCPVYNEAILDCKRIFNFSIEENKMWGLGTPEDLNYYLENYKI